MIGVIWSVSGRFNIVNELSNEFIAAGLHLLGEIGVTFGVLGLIWNAEEDCEEVDWLALLLYF